MNSQFFSFSYTNCTEDNDLAKDELTHLGKKSAYYSYSLIVESLENSGPCLIKQAMKACMSFAIIYL